MHITARALFAVPSDAPKRLNTCLLPRRERSALACSMNAQNASFYYGSSRLRRTRPGKLGGNRMGPSAPGARAFGRQAVVGLKKMCAYGQRKRATMEFDDWHVFSRYPNVLRLFCERGEVIVNASGIFPVKGEQDAVETRRAIVRECRAQMMHAVPAPPVHDLRMPKLEGEWVIV